MNYNFPYALDLLLKHEGGWSKHPADPGGATNYGITLQTYSLFLGRKAKESELRVIGRDMVGKIYKQRYWDMLRCDDLYDGLDYAVFDMGVNSGVSRASRFLQGMVNAHPDGVIGPRTIAAVEAWVDEHDLKYAIEEFCRRRLHYLEALPTFSTFGRGWTRRVNEVKAAALDMARS